MFDATLYKSLIRNYPKSINPSLTKRAFSNSILTRIRVKGWIISLSFVPFAYAINSVLMRKTSSYYERYPTRTEYMFYPNWSENKVFAESKTVSNVLDN